MHPRGVAELLRLNNLLTLYERILNTHKSNLEKIQKDLFDRTFSAIQEAKKTIEQILSEKKQRSKGRRQRRVKAGKVQADAPSKKELVHAKDKPQSIIDVVSLMDMEVSDEIRQLLEYIDQEVIRQKLSDLEYSELISDLVCYLEETL